MPASVHIPVRLRLDPESLDRDCCIESALSDAAARALATSRKEVMAPRGGWAGVCMHTPEFMWSGLGVEHATAEMRTRIEKLVQATLEREIERSGIVDLARHNVTARSPLSEPAAEAFDPERGFLGTYAIPVYNGRGKKRAVPVKAPSAPPKPVKTEIRGQWLPSRFDWAEGMKLSDLMGIEELTFDDWGMVYPSSGSVGMIWQQTGGNSPLRLYIRQPNGVINYFGVPLFRGYKPKVEGVQVEFEYREFLPQPAAGSAEWVTIDEMRARFRANIEARLRETPKPPLMEQAEYEALIAVAAEAESIRQSSGNEGYSDVLALTIGGDTMFLLYEPDRPRWAGIIPVGPLSDLKQVEVADESKEKGAGGDGEATDATGEKGEKGKQGGGKRGAFVLTGEEGEPAETGALLPTVGFTGAEEECDDPFVGEPSIEELDPAARDALKEMIAEIAFRLDIKPCNYAGRFALHAADVLGGRALGVSQYAVSEGHGNMLLPTHAKTKPGVVRFIPSATPAVQFMRHLAGVTPLLSVLSRTIQDVYRQPQHAALIKGVRHNHAIGWSLDFGYPFNQSLLNSVKMLFLVTTRLILLQLLYQSKLQIDARLNEKTFDDYAAFFQEVVQADLVPEQELEDMKTTLTRIAGTGSVGRDLTTSVVDSWRSARGALMDVLERRNPFANIGAGVAGTPVLGDNGHWGIRDSKGFVWSLEQLERAIAVRKETAVQIDPLAQQLVADKRVKERFTRNPDNIKGELRSLLEEMASNNQNITRKAYWDLEFAFDLAAIHTDDQNETIPDTGFVLSGTHLQAHLALYEFFGGSRYYNDALKDLLQAEDWNRTLANVLEIGITMIASIVCPPLGAALNLGFAIYHEYKAQEKLQVYQSLIDPEVILSYAEVEAELFAADIGLIFSVVPGGRFAGVGAKAGVKLAQGGVKAAKSYLIQQIDRRIIQVTKEALKQNMVKALITHVAMFEVMSNVMEKMLAPVMEEIQREHFTIDQLDAIAAEVEVE